MGPGSGPPWYLPHCECLCRCGIISIPAIMLAAFFDWNCALCIIAINVVVMVSVGHLNSRQADMG